MADQQFSKMYDVERIGGDQRTRLAEMLRANMLNQPQGQMISGWYVPPSWTQQLAPALGGIIGTQMGKDIEEEERKNIQEDIKQYSAAQQAQALRKQGQPTGTPVEQVVSPMYPSTPAAGRVEGGEFRLMKTGGVEGMPNYGATPQQTQPQQIDPYDYSQYKSRGFTKMLQQQQLANLMAVPEWSTDVKYDQQGRAFVTNKQGDFKYIGSENAPIRKAVDYNEPFIMNDQGQWVPNTAYQQYSMSKSRAGAANVSVNTGQKGFDNTLKLRSDFRSEPIYKGFQEVKSAYDQVREAAKLASPAGDLAAATKVMKILDPGSVVRESELGMAMQAGGLGDRISNYANMVVSGTKLTPAQRKDFLNLSEQLYNASAGQYNTKRGEYVGIAERNQLNVQDVVGSEAKMQKPASKVKFLGFE